MVLIRCKQAAVGQADGGSKGRGVSAASTRSQINIMGLGTHPRPIPAGPVVSHDLLPSITVTMMPEPWPQRTRLGLQKPPTLQNTESFAPGLTARGRLSRKPAQSKEDVDVYVYGGLRGGTLRRAASRARPHRRAPRARCASAKRAPVARPCTAPARFSRSLSGGVAWVAAGDTASSQCRRAGSRRRGCARRYWPKALNRRLVLRAPFRLETVAPCSACQISASALH